MLRRLFWVGRAPHPRCSTRGRCTTSAPGCSIPPARPTWGTRRCRRPAPGRGRGCTTSPRAPSARESGSSPGR
eukprot:6910628-Prymnesium_polylepis.1